MVYRRYTDADKAAYYARKAQVTRPSRYSGAKSASRYNKRKPTKKRRASSKYDYPGVGRMIGSGLGSMAGNMIVPGVGGTIGGALGGAVGQGAHALVKKITGFGDYHVSKNSLVYNVDAIPEFSTGNERCTVVCHREFISDIKSSIVFNVQEFRINPAIDGTFPWLSSIAENYEQYVVQGMVFEFKTTSATAIGSTNTTLGTVIMATQYNSLAPPFTNKQQMENYEFSQSAIPSQSILHPIECDPMQTQCGGIFNMYNSSDSNGDTRLYDIGRFNIATVGMQAADATIGELWVSYKICLLKPRLQYVNDVSDLFVADIANITGAAPVGNYTSLEPLSSNSNVVQFTSNTTVTIDAGFVGVLQFIYAIYCNPGAAPLLVTPYLTCTGNCIDVTAYYTGLTGAGAINSEVDFVDTLDHPGYTVQYIRCSGGYVPSTGLPMTLTFVGGTFTDLAVSNCRVSFISMPAALASLSA